MDGTNKNKTELSEFELNNIATATGMDKETIRNEFG